MHTQDEARQSAAQWFGPDTDPSRLIAHQVGDRGWYVTQTAGSGFAVADARNGIISGLTVGAEPVEGVLDDLATR